MWSNVLCAVEEVIDSEAETLTSISNGHYTSFYDSLARVHGEGQALMWLIRCLSPRLLDQMLVHEAGSENNKFAALSFSGWSSELSRSVQRYVCASRERTSAETRGRSSTHC